MRIIAELTHFMSVFHKIYVSLNRSQIRFLSNLALHCENFFLILSFGKEHKRNINSCVLVKTGN